jgi:putative hydrolases of HD superfamily
MQIESLLKFFELLNTVQCVRRTVFVKGEERLENDIEHQYQLAVVSWYIIVTEKLSLNVDRTIQYALVHDMVEAYAGDMHFYKRNEEEKKEREHAAAQRLREEFPEFADMHALIAGYERREDPESRFVYALDKLLPIVNIYLDKGRSWKIDGVTREMIETNKTEKIAISPDIKKIFDEMILRLKEEEVDLFL